MPYTKGAFSLHQGPGLPRTRLFHFISGWSEVERVPKGVKRHLKLAPQLTQPGVLTRLIQEMKGRSHFSIHPMIKF